MATTDLDPLFVRALKLLNSKSKESAAQLKAMVDEAIAQRKGLKVPAQSGDAGKLSPARSKGDDDYKRKDADKRSLEKGGKDSSEPDVKKSKLDSKHRSKEEKDAREKEREKDKARRDRDKKEKEEKEAQRQREKAEKEKKEKAMLSSKQENEVTMISDDDEESSSQLDAGDFALEMGIACVVCKQFGFSSGNQLVECQECHSVYHQECHKPPVAEETVNDPRYVWYCNRCQKMLQKKQQQKPVAKPSKASAPLTPGKETSTLISSSAKPFKSETSAVPLGGASAGSTTSQAFRKIDPKVIVPPKETNSQSKPILGLAGLAANLTKPQSKSGISHRKSDQKGGDNPSKSSKTEVSKPSTKVDGNSHSSKPKSEEKRPDKPSSSSEKERKYESGSSKSSSSSNSSSSREEKKSSSETSSKSSSTSSSSSSSSSAPDRDKKSSESGSKSEKKSSSSDSSKSSSGSTSSGLKLDVSSSSSSSVSRSSPSQAVTPETPDSPSASSSKLGVGVPASSTDKNKKAMATLFMITANKRMQMMMKKAQAKPSDKKVHIK